MLTGSMCTLLRCLLYLFVGCFCMSCESGKQRGCTDLDTSGQTIYGRTITCDYYLPRSWACIDDNNCAICVCSCQQHGNFCSAIETFNTCDLCEAGKYKSSTGTAACESCPATTTSPPGSVAASACACGVGFTEESTCVQCAVGKYKDLIASTECSACPKGTSSALGSVSVNDCKCHVGNISGERTGCEQCVAGKFFSLLAGPPVCVDCPNGQACDDCGPGWYAAVIGATFAVHCLECGEGKMLKAKLDGCLLCPVAYNARLDRSICFR